MNWKDEPLLSWLSRRVPSWANDQILGWADAFPRGEATDIMQFVIEEHSNPNTTIDMRTVVGQWEHYAGQSWLEALNNPHWKPWKMQNNLAEADHNPGYYFSGDIHGDVHFDSTDGIIWYTNNGGCHRTIIAKFLSEMCHEKTGHYPHVAGVSTTRYVVDWESYGLFKELLAYRDHGIHVSLQSREHLGSLIFQVGDFRFNRDGKFEQLTAKQFCSYAKWIISNDAKLTKLDKLQHWRQFWFGDPAKLVFFN